MPKITLSPEQRRKLIYEVALGGSPTQLAKKHRVSRSRVYAILDEAKTNPEQKLKEAEAELALRLYLVENPL